MAWRLAPWLLLAALAAGRLLAVPAVILAPLAWWAVILLPGSALARWVLPAHDPSVVRHRGLDRWLAITVVGLLLQSVWMSLTDILRIPPGAILLIPPLLAAVAVSATGRPATPEPARREPWTTSLPTYGLVLLGIILAIRFAAIPLTGSDALAHLDGIRQVVETGEPFPHVDAVDGMAGLKPDPRFGTWHPIVAAVWTLAGGQLALTWAWIGLLMAAPLLGAVDLLGRALFRTSRAGFVSLAVYLLIVWRAEGELLSLLAFPSVVTRPVFLFGVVWILALLHRRKLARRDLLWSGLFAAGLSMLRLDYFTMFAGMLALVLGLDALGRREGSRTWLLPVAGLCFAVAAPFLIYKYALSLPVPEGYLADNETGHLFLWRQWHVTNPLRMFGPAGCLLVLLALTWFLRAWRYLSSPTAILLGAMWIGGLQAYNPLFYSAFEPVLSAPYVQRLSKLMPLYWTVAAALLGLDLARSGSWRQRSLRGVIALTVVVLGVQGLAKVSPATLASRHRQAAAMADTELLDWLREHGTRETTVLAHPRVGYVVAGLTDLQVVAVPPAHASPWVLDAKQRERDALLALSPCLTVAERTEILDRYAVDWVVIRTDPPGTSETTERRSAPLPALGFNAPVFSTAGYAVHAAADALQPEHGPEDLAAWCGAPFRPNEVPAQAPEVYPGVRASVLLPPGFTVSGGDVLRLPVTWYCETSLDTDPVWIARFDTDFPRGPLYSDRVGKPYRKLRELLSGRRYRFRGQGPAGGRFSPPTAWDPGEKFEDVLEIAVPPDLHPGIYEVQLQLLDLEGKPILWISDYLENADRYAGEVVGQIVIEAQPSGEDS